MLLTFLYTNSEAVIPAKAGIQPRKTGFRVKPGMTNKEKNWVGATLVALSVGGL
jgi:hypothetical protein